MIESPRAEPRATHREPDLLTWDDLNVVIGLLAEVAPGWSADLNHASPNESTIVVTPEGANDLIGPASPSRPRSTGWLRPSGVANGPGGRIRRCAVTRCLCWRGGRPRRIRRVGNNNWTEVNK